MSEPSEITGLPSPQVATQAVGIPATPRSTLKPSFSRMPVRYFEVSNSWKPSSPKLKTLSTMTCACFFMPSIWPARSAFMPASFSGEALGCAERQAAESSSAREHFRMCDSFIERRSNYLKSRRVGTASRSSGEAHLLRPSMTRPDPEENPERYSQCAGHCQQEPTSSELAYWKSALMRFPDLINMHTKLEERESLRGRKNLV